MVQAPRKHSTKATVVITFCLVYYMKMMQQSEGGMAQNVYILAQDH